MKLNIIESARYWLAHDCQDLARHDAVVKFFGLLTVIAIIPFAFIEFVQGRYLIFLVECVAILLILSEIIYSHYFNRTLLSRVLVLSGIGIIIWFVIFQKGVIGIYWAFPYVAFLHFSLNPRFAVIINIIFILGLVPLAFNAVGDMEAYRVFITVTLCSLVALIYSVVQEQHRITQLNGEARFSALYEDNPTMFFSINEDSKVLSVNQYGIEQLGYPKEQLIGQSVLNVFHKEDRLQADKYMKQCFREPDVVHEWELRKIHQDGSEIWVREMVRVVDDFYGKPMALIVCNDVSEQREAKEALKNSENHYRNLIETTAAVAWEVDVASQEFTYISPQVGVISGFPMEQWTDFSFWAEHIHPDDRDQAVEFCMAKTAKGLDHSFDYRMITADDRIIWLRDIASVIKCEGQPSTLRGYFIDITERKLAEEAINKTNRILKVLNQCNQVLLHAIDEQQLLDDICKIIVDTGESRMAGVGIVEHDENKTVRMVTHHGYEHDYLANANVNWREDNERGQGPVGIAIRSGRPYITRDMSVDPVFAPWREAAIERGYASNVVLPLISSGKTLGVLLIYSSEPDAIDDDELELLIKLSDNMAYGMMALRTNQIRKQVELQLHDVYSQLNAIIESEPECVKTVAKDGTLLSMNPAGLVMVEAEFFDEIDGASVYDLIAPEHCDNFKELNERIFAGESGKLKFEVIGLKGGRKWLESHATPLLNKAGEIIAQLAVTRDITEYKQVEEELLKLSHAVEASSSSVIITNANGNIEYVNPKFTEYTGYTKEEVLGQIPRFLLQTEETLHSASVYDDISQSIKSKGEWKGEFRNQRKDGSLYWDRASISCVKNAEGEITHYIGIQDDVTHEYELAEQLSYQASHDNLTGLINRREFERRAERLLTGIQHNKGEHAICYMDLDKFKIVNDTCGHHAGDELLRQITLILQDTVRKRDTLARLGGDEFGILMEHCSLEDANRVANSILSAIRDYQFYWEGQSFRIGMSIGLATITELTPNLTEMMKQADAACYKAKDLGRNRIHVYHTEDTLLAQRHGEIQWVTRLQQALEKDSFCLYAQSIEPLDGSSGKYYELLIRLKDEKGELILPGAFLPAAERYNLMVKLDLWVIEKTFTSLTNNPDFIKQINFISINLSGSSVTESSVLDFIIAQLDESGIDRNKICFEITEISAISNLTAAIKFISTLKGFGCQFALDDFGNGLSSFAYLKNLPVDYLKIDGMFVKDIVEDPVNHAMVKSINEIGKVMGMKTIAEFVENDEIKGMLREIGVIYAQGYGIEKPVSFDALLDRSNNVSYINSLKDKNFDS